MHHGQPVNEKEMKHETEELRGADIVRWTGIYGLERLRLQVGISAKPTLNRCKLG